MQFAPGSPDLPGGIQFRQDPVIPPQPVVDIPHEIVAVLVDLIIKGIATAVTTELFVLAAHDFFGAFQTYFIHGYMAYKLTINQI